MSGFYIPPQKQLCDDLKTEDNNVVVIYMIQTNCKYLNTNRGGEILALTKLDSKCSNNEGVMIYMTKTDL
jgi:hypothetical protein